MDHDAASLPPVSPEHRRVAAGQFERATQVIANGDYDYGIGLLLSCCKLDPGNLIYRKKLRQTQKLRHKNNLRGSWLAWLTTAPAKARIRRALMTRDYLAVLEQAENVLVRNPWDVRTQVALATAADALGQLDLAVWALEQARDKAAEDAQLNRTLARLYEKQGDFRRAIELWELVRKIDPHDTEAMGKAKDLAATETIARGRYESSVTDDAVSSRRSRRERDSKQDDPPSSSSEKRRRKRSAEKPAAAPAPKPAVFPIPDDDATPSERKTARDAAAMQARIDADPGNVNNYLQLAELYRKNGQFDQAREVLFKGLTPTSNNFDVSIELADLEIEPFRQNLAIAEQRLRDNPDEDLRRLRIRLLKEINTRELDLFRRKADRFPTDMGHRFEMGVRLLRAGQVDEAIKELQAARNDPRHQWRSLLYLGHCFKTRNNWRLARRNFEEALQNLPASGEEAARKEVLFQLASGCADAGDYQGAVHFATELANLDFGYREINNLLDEWSAKLEQARRGDLGHSASGDSTPSE